MRRVVIVRTRFEAVHCWPECPFEDVAFLRNPHRHEFHVEVEIEVKHDDRDVEFIQAKGHLQKCISDSFRKDIGRMSCELIAEQIVTGLIRWYQYRIVSVSVFEDGENGAKVYFD